MNTNPTTSAGMIHMLLKYAADTGMDDRGILSSAGIDPAVLENPDVRIPARTFDALWKEVASKSNDENFGLHFSQTYHVSSGGNILFAMMMNCPTVGSAIDTFCRYHNLMNDAVRPRLEVSDDVALFGWEACNPAFKPSRHTTEALLSILYTIFRRLTEYTCTALEVRFQHLKPENITEHTRIFQAPLMFGRETSTLVLDKKDLGRKVFLANPELLETLEQYALNLLHKIYLPDTFSDRVVRLLAKHLYGNNPSLESIAKEMALSVRTLQTRLGQEGTTFTKLLDHVREELALMYLKDREFSIYDVAFLLGFSEQSAFNHAFKRWTGTTPKKYRNNDCGSDS